MRLVVVRRILGLIGHVGVDQRPTAVHKHVIGVWGNIFVGKRIVGWRIAITIVSVAFGEWIAGVVVGEGIVVGSACIISVGLFEDIIRNVTIIRIRKGEVGSASLEGVSLSRWAGPEGVVGRIRRCSVKDVLCSVYSVITVISIVVMNCSRIGPTGIVSIGFIVISVRMGGILIVIVTSLWKSAGVAGIIF